jgi:predicted NAD/FAD-binding protein
MKKKIAIVGSGVSGLSAAWLLSEKYEVTVFEANQYLGGHCHTITASFGEKKFSFDTGFMVYNEHSYPELTKLFKHLKIETQRADMSFSVSLNDGLVEWAGNSLGKLFADRKNIFRPSFYLFLLEILRFNRIARQTLVTSRQKPDFAETVDAFIKRHHLSSVFTNQYLYPLTSLIWSTPQSVTKEYPIIFVLDFLANHNLLSIRPRLPWRSVTGGSIKYIEILSGQVTERGGQLLTSMPVKKVKRVDNKIHLTTQKGEEIFDAVVFGTHADVTLQLLSDVTEDEERILGSFMYQKNIVTAHSDVSLMPVRKKAWSAWNFCDVVDGDVANEMSLTYNMNILNGLPLEYPIFVTINPMSKVNPTLVHDTFKYAHPSPTQASKAAQQELHTLQGNNGTFFCGSYFGYGFHEDGFCSGKEVARLLGVDVPWK